MKKSNKKFKIYLYYLESLLVHKKYVFQAGRQVGKIPLWRLVFHDWHKFTLSEFPYYAMQFFASDTVKNQNILDTYQNDSNLISDDFELAWLHHENHSPHHWGYWLQKSSDKTFSMPETYVREMVADWMGASKSYTGSWDMTEWMNDNASYIAGHMTQLTLRRLCTILNQHYNGTAFDKFIVDK